MVTLTGTGKRCSIIAAPGQLKIRLRGHPGSQEFMAAYDVAKTGGVKIEIGSSRTVPGTVNAALISYYQSPAFTKGLAESTQDNRRVILERFREEHGDKRIALMHCRRSSTARRRQRPATSKRQCAASSSIACRSR
jgi:hypothetical protein